VDASPVEPYNVKINKNIFFKKKYADLANQFIIAPIAFVTMGAVGDESRDFIEDLSERISGETGESRKGYYMQQRLYIALQRGDSAAVLGWLKRSEVEDA